MKELKVRISDALAAQLKALADSERRSVNAQVALLIERAVREQESPPVPAPGAAQAE